MSRWGTFKRGASGGAMENETAALYWLQVAEAVPVRFADLARLLAVAQFPGDSDRAALSRVVAQENIAERLSQLVASRALTVRNRHGMTRLDAPLGQQLQDALLIPSVDLEPLRAEFGIGIRFTPHGNGPTHWTVENAAAAIAEQEGWHFGARDTLRQQMMQAARDGTLTIRHPHMDLPYRPEVVRDFYELVTRADVNAWLERTRELLRWLPDGGPAAGTPEPAAAEPVSAVGQSLETPKDRRARLLEWHEEEENARGKHGALARVFAREKVHRPTADRSNIGKGIRKARAERAEERRAGALLGPLGKQR